MASGAEPTNEHIVDLLNRVLRQLDQVQKTQEDLTNRLRQIAPVK